MSAISSAFDWKALGQSALQGLTQAGIAMLQSKAQGKAQTGTIGFTAPLPTMVPTPGLGFGAVPGAMFPRRRRRGRGFSARDIRQTRKMMRLIRDFQTLAPRRHTHYARRK